jgi:hypothetical protein
VIAGLAADGWTRPEQLFKPQTLKDLAAHPDRVPTLAKVLAAPPTTPLAGWTLNGRLGNFAGFDGHFEAPPLLLNAGDQGHRHRFWVRSGEINYRIDADLFGWVCRPDASVDFPVNKATPRRQEKRTDPLPAGATSMVAGDALLAYTLADSFRVRVLTPSRTPL